MPSVYTSHYAQPCFLFPFNSTHDVHLLYLYNITYEIHIMCILRTKRKHTHENISQKELFLYGIHSYHMHPLPPPIVQLPRIKRIFSVFVFIFLFYTLSSSSFFVYSFYVSSISLFIINIVCEKIYSGSNKHIAGGYTQLGCLVIHFHIRICNQKERQAKAKTVSSGIGRGRWVVDVVVVYG